MNIIDYAIRLGYAIRKTKEGKSIIRAKESLMEKYKDLSEDNFFMFKQLVDNGKGQDHFYSLFITLEKGKQYLAREEKLDPELKSVFEFALENKQINTLANSYKKLGDSVQQIQKAWIGYTK